MFILKVAAAFVLTACLYWACWVWAALPFGSKWFLGFSFFLPVASLFALGGIAVGVVGLFWVGSRNKALRTLALSTAVVAGSALGVWLGPVHKMQRIRHVAAAAMPLVHALESFVEREHRTPQNLAELIPRYVLAVPSTGMGGYSEWEYVTGPQARELYDGNPWVLLVKTGGPGFNFDTLMYFPNQDYPAVGYGGSVERIGVWAYVYE